MKTKWIVHIRHRIGVFRRESYSWRATELANPNFSVKLKVFTNYTKFSSNEKAIQDWKEFAKVNSIIEWDIM